jgi:hypothetical protein
MNLLSQINKNRVGQKKMVMDPMEHLNKKIAGESQ